MPSSHPAGVLVVGDVMTDIICRPTGPLVPGSDRRATIRARPGGSGANQAVWLAAFGLDVRFAARVGSIDAMQIKAHFAALGVEAALAADPDLPSGTLVTLVDPGGERSFLTDRGANAALSATDLPETLLDNRRLLVVSGYSLFEAGPRAAVMALLNAARRRDIAIAIDPASTGFLDEVGPAHFLAWTQGADMIFANEAEASCLTGAPAADAQLEHLLRHYRRVIIKRGAAGALYGDKIGLRLDHKAPSVAVIDTTGAGDAFAAAFIAADLQGAPPATSLERAVNAGSRAVTEIGGQPGRRESPTHPG